MNVFELQMKQISSQVRYSFLVKVNLMGNVKETHHTI